MKLRDRKLSQLKLELTGDELCSLGPALELDHCHVVSRCRERMLVVPGLTMRGGSFEQKVQLTNFQFSDAHFQGVRFEGKYVGCDFGDWDSVAQASISDCDFSAAVLDACRFLNCQPETIRFPPWPCFAIFHPHAAASTVASKNWPDELEVVLDTYRDALPACAAIVRDARKLAREQAMPLDALLDLLKSLPGIHLTD
ncbi:hypothetical protein [Niveibacterium sp. SC-1]|uniref:hypothetical protein n=1 Tax=Niveibacterium sp. SC-1 TaxID=3135646 RepID=UPI00311E6E21